MKDILATEPWTFIACHSFDNILLAGDDSHNVTSVPPTSYHSFKLIPSFWDWGLARKTGSIKLNLAPGHRMTSARFVNELHPNNIVIAEISASPLLSEQSADDR
jgi:regulator-associated protein of mTOR